MANGFRLTLLQMCPCVIRSLEGNGLEIVKSFEFFFILFFLTFLFCINGKNIVDSLNVIVSSHSISTSVVT